MCTALSFKTNSDFYFGRTLDVCSTHGERVVEAPRGFALRFRREGVLNSHYAILGMAHVANNFPLYYDAINEKGLCMAGLNFPQNAVYHPVEAGKKNIAPFELIPYILGNCASVEEAKILLKSVNVCDINFSESMPHTPLHWMISDKTGDIVAESVADGLKVYDNPVGVMTNNPTFDVQLFNLRNYARLSTSDPENTFSKQLDLAPYSRGMGALGMPGDWSSPSRFVRAVFVKYQYKEGDSNDFFHILASAEVPKNCVETPDGFQYTVYSCCCNALKGEYSYKTYADPTPVTVAFTDIDGNQLI